MVNTIYLLSFVETPRKFIIAELSIRKLGSSSVLIIVLDVAVVGYIENGIYSLVFTPPESMLATKRWDKILKSQSFIENCVCIAVDEARCISRW